MRSRNLRSGSPRGWVPPPHRPLRLTDLPSARRRFREDDLEKMESSSKIRPQHPISSPSCALRSLTSELAGAAPIDLTISASSLAAVFAVAFGARLDLDEMVGVGSLPAVPCQSRWGTPPYSREPHPDPLVLRCLTVDARCETHLRFALSLPLYFGGKFCTQ